MLGKFLILYVFLLIYLIKYLLGSIFRMVIRIRCDAEIAQCQLGNKFGCDPLTEAPGLLRAAYELGINVIGVSFHVGSGCGDPPAFRKAIKLSRQIFDYADSIGFNFNLLDIGGGFPGSHGSSINKVSDDDDFL